MLLRVVLARALWIAGDGSIIYGGGDGAEAIASRLCNCHSPSDWTRSTRETLRPVALRAAAFSTSESLAASVTTATAVLGSGDCSDSPAPNSPYSSSDSSAVDTGRGTRRRESAPDIAKYYSTHMNSKSLMDLIPSALSLLSTASGAPVSRTR